MPQYPTKVPSNVGKGSGVTAGDPGFSYKYHKFTYAYNNDAADSAAVTGVPLGTAPCPCTYVGMTAYIGTGTPSTSVVTYSPLKVPKDAPAAARTGTALNTTLCSFGTTVVAYPAYCASLNIEQAGQTTTRASNATTTTTGITAPVFDTGSTVQFRQGDIVALTSTGTFTGVRGVIVEVYLREDNGNY